MSKVVETSAVVLSDNNSLPVTRQDLKAVSERRAIIKEFVNKQLKKGSDSDGDYAVIKGTKKPTLLKPGAEKLCQLFGLRVEINEMPPIIDHNGNFAMFSHKASVYHIRSGEKLAECIGSCNSKEKKYATRAVWKGNEKHEEETPIYDILNTLSKMSQKRAFVGVVVQATGASDFFTHDIDTQADAEQVGATVMRSEEVTGLGSKTEDMQISFCVSGDTVSHKDTLKSMGGKWNMNDKRWDFINSTAENYNKANSLKGAVVKKL